MVNSVNRFVVFSPLQCRCKTAIVPSQQSPCSCSIFMKYNPIDTLIILKPLLGSSNQFEAWETTHCAGPIHLPVPLCPHWPEYGVWSTRIFAFVPEMSDCCMYYIKIVPGNINQVYSGLFSGIPRPKLPWFQIFVNTMPCNGCPEFGGLYSNLAAVSRLRRSPNAACDSWAGC